MQFSQPLLEGTLIRRYKRFLADVKLDNGDLITAHTPNTGSMLGCCEPGSRVWLSHSGNPKRKYPYGWELVRTAGGCLVGINTALPNRLVREAIDNGRITELQGYTDIRHEVRYGRENSRIDLLLEAARRPACYAEVKNITLAEDGVAWFPDAVSERATRHLRELEQVVLGGERGVLVFCVQRDDAREFRPAGWIDKDYARTLQQVSGNGVEVLAYQAKISPHAIELALSLPVVLD